jgi:serine protease SohB
MALADEITTSDQYISRMVHEADVFEVHYVLRKRLQDKLSAGVSVTIDRLLLTWISRFHNQRFW